MFRSITTLCRIDNIPHNIPHIHIECGEYFRGMFSVQENIDMHLNNAMIGLLKHLVIKGLQECFESVNIQFLDMLIKLHYKVVLHVKPNECSPSSHFVA